MSAADPQLTLPGPRLGATVRDRVAGQLRDRIMSGQLAAGMRIDLDEVAAEIGASRTPVREACLTLMHEGLVRMAPRSGVTVLGVTPRDVRDNFALMATLSGMAAAWAAERSTAAQLAVIRGRCTDVVHAAEARAGDGLATANFRFHREINRASDSVRLMALLRQTARIIPMSFFDVVPERIPCSLAEHEEIVDALAARDPVRARAAAEGHLLSAGQHLSAHLFGSLGLSLRRRR